MVVLGPEPFVGPRPFEVDDRDFFHGRARECREVVALWQSERLLILYGPSGAGKTSLIQAGVILRFNEQTADLLPVGRLALSVSPTASDQAERNPFTHALLSSWATDERPEAPADLSIAEFLVRRRKRTDRYGDPLPVLAVIDRFEELYGNVLYQQHHIDAFLDDLAKAIDRVPSLRVLVSMKETALAHFLPRETSVAGYWRARFRLEYLSPGAAVEAVTEAVTRAGRSFAPGVAEHLVRDLRTTEVKDTAGQVTRLTADLVQPLHLQVVCAGLWRALPTSTAVISHADIERHGNVVRAVAEFCRQMVAEVADQALVPRDEVHRWLASTFVTEHGTRASAYEGVSMTGGMPNSIPRALVVRHVLTAEHRAGSRWYELTHDGLIAAIRQLASVTAPATGGDQTLTSYLRAAERALTAGDFALAERQAERALRAPHPGDAEELAEVLALRGEIAVQARRLWAAEGHYWRALEHTENPEDEQRVGDLLARIARLQRQRGSPADAVDTLESACRRRPHDPTIKLELANALRSSRTATPDAADDLIDQLRLELADPAETIEQLDELRRLSPPSGKRADARAARALARARTGQIDRATMDEAETAERDAPGSAAVLLRAAGVAYAAGDQVLAERRLRAAAKAGTPVLSPAQQREARELLAGRLHESAHVS